MDSFILWLIIEITVCLIGIHTLEATMRRPKPIPPSKYERTEINSNDTIDKIIFNVMGGKKIPSNFKRRPLPNGQILAELDMMLTQPQFHSLYNKSSKLTHVAKRKATRSERLRWTNNELVYKFAPNHFLVGYNRTKHPIQGAPEEIYHLKRSMTEWERYTCLRFRKAKSSDKNIVRIQNGQGCNSQLGMVRGTQALNLETPGCRFKGLYIHEIGHAIGLVHEHQLPNRDDYIQIIYENVEPDMRIWFNKYRSDEVNQYDVAYEYSSVMHYGITAFSADQTSQTIRAKYSELEYQIGRVYQKELSFTDTKIVNKMYGCGGSCLLMPACSNGGFVGENCQCICKDGTNDCEDDANVPDPSCVNTHDSWQCYIWAQQGECERNRGFMKAQCQRACGLCDWSNDPHPDTCRNVYSNDKCEKWAEYGDCVTNEKWMAVNCMVACKACSSSDNSHTNCNNVHANQAECDEWARKGECLINLDWMFDNCKKSCMMCDKTDKPTTGDDDDEPGVCINRHDDAQCEYWANDNECDNNPGWMHVNCMKSCLLCTRGGECVDLYETSSCSTWASNDECKENPVWMTENCRKSCDACEKSEICSNEHNDGDCDAWAGTGECTENPSWMLKHCKKSCNVCSTENNINGASLTVGGVVLMVCVIFTALLSQLLLAR